MTAISCADFKVMDETLGYEGTESARRTDDVSRLKIVPGEGRYDLHGINTHRLLVSGHRVAIPLPRAVIRPTCATNVRPNWARCHDHRLHDGRHAVVLHYGRAVDVPDIEHAARFRLAA